MAWLLYLLLTTIEVRHGAATRSRSAWCCISFQSYLRHSGLRRFVCSGRTHKIHVNGMQPSVRNSNLTIEAHTLVPYPHCPHHSCLILASKSFGYCKDCIHNGPILRITSQKSGVVLPFFRSCHSCCWPAAAFDLMEAAPCRPNLKGLNWRASFGDINPASPSTCHIVPRFLVQDVI